MNFDPQVSWGNIISALTFIVGLKITYSAAKRKLDDSHRETQDRLLKIEQRVEIFYKWFDHNVLRGRHTDE